MPELVQCKDCGFLSLLETETNELVEAGEQLRTTGQPQTVFVMHVGHVMAYSVKPICFERAFPISSNWNDTDGDKENIKRIVDEQRQCPSFRKWQQGFSPKEHAEMMQQEALLAWQDRQAASSRRHNNMTLAIAVTSTLIAAAVGAANFFKPNLQPIVNVTMPATAPIQSMPATIDEPQLTPGVPMLLPTPNRRSADPADPLPDSNPTY